MQPGGRHIRPLLSSWRFLLAYRFESAMDLLRCLITYQVVSFMLAINSNESCMHMLRSGEGSQALPPLTKVLSTGGHSMAGPQLSQFQKRKHMMEPELQFNASLGVYSTPSGSLCQAGTPGTLARPRQALHTVIARLLIGFGFHRLHQMVSLMRISSACAWMLPLHAASVLL